MNGGSCSHLSVASKHWPPCNWKITALPELSGPVGLSAVSPNEMDQIVPLMSTLVLSPESSRITLDFPADYSVGDLERGALYSRHPRLYLPPWILSRRN